MAYIRDEINNEMTLTESIGQFEKLLASFESELKQLSSENVENIDVQSE